MDKKSQVGTSYAEAGVNVEAGYEVVARIRGAAESTFIPGVLGGLGGFGGTFDLTGYDLDEPVLVSGTDGVGTKLLVAAAAGIHDTIGIDCVAMCVNDVAAAGARPIYFLDYLATGKTDPAQVAAVVGGIAEGCRQAGAALIGGETAEMPGLYDEGEYDLAGFAVGIAEKSQLLHPDLVREGDTLVGLPSSGLHSNGYSLVRKVFFQDGGFADTDILPEFAPKSLTEVLLEPTRIYVKDLLPLVEEKLLSGAAHITGGGFVENLPRILPAHLAAKIHKGSWPIPEVFLAVEKYGQVPPEEMYEIFNMGIGMVVAVHPENLPRVEELLDGPYFVIGEVVAREAQGVVFA